MTSPTNKASSLAAAVVALGLFAAPGIAAADEAATAPAPGSPADLEALRSREAADAARLDEQAALLAAQADALAKTRALVQQQQAELASLKQALGDAQAKLAAAPAAPAAGGDQQLQIAELEDTRAAGVQAGSEPAGSGPVGEAPPTHANAALALPLPEGIDVLTPVHHLVFDNAVEYQNSSSDRVVFSGVQIVNALQIGLLEANQTSNDTAMYMTTLRYGLFNNLEVELMAPWTARFDRVTTLQTLTPATDLTDVFNLKGAGLGDVEGTVRYQFNSGRDGWPIFVGSVRAVSDTGTGPFQVPYNDQGVALKLPTGSGFWQINPQVTAIYPADPVVLFGSVGYQHGFARDIDKFFGTGQSIVHVGEVTPGDSAYVALGFVFSLNSRFSYSLGYKHTYFWPTLSQFLPTSNNIGIVKGQTLSLNDGQLLAGASYRINDHVSINLNWEYGVTADAPNDTIILRVPYLF